MASAALFIGWGTSVVGRERQAMHLFDDSIEFWTRLQQARAITSYEAFLLEPHGTNLAGFFVLRGEAEALGRLRGSAEFQRLSMRAGFVVNDYRVVSAISGEALNQRFVQYNQLAAELA